MGKIDIKKDYCKGCQLCIIACTRKLLKVGQEFNKSGYYVVQYVGKEGECTGCTLCAEMCPDLAIEVWR